jgi:hypothetical protein
MVVRTPPLGSLRRGLLPQIHQPLVLNKRESQQLLQSITTSFRKNLDREHGWETDETSTTTATKARSDLTEPPASTANHRPTDRHLRAILTNPLFAQPRDVHIDAPTHAAISKALPIFDAAVAKGLMTTRRAAGFLATIRAQLSAESPNDIRQRMASSEAGLRVLKWLRASGQENSLDFLRDTALVKVIVPFLYAEGLQEVAWTWLARLAARATELEYEHAPGRTNAQTLSRLISVIISENSASNFSLDSSFAALARVNDILPREKPVAATALRSTWAQLSWATTVGALERPKPSVALFENFVDIGRPLSLPLDQAHLALHHPTTPTYSAAIEYLRLRQQIVDDLTTMKPRGQQRVLCLVLDVAERLRRTGQATEAAWVERMRNAIYDRLNLGIMNAQVVSLDSGLPFHRNI